MSITVPVNTPLLDGNEKKYLSECIDTGWISSEGPYVKQFEEQFATRVERKYGVAVSNGSAALDVAVAALGIGPGDEVILPTFTIISCAASIVRAGATPVVVDSDPATWNMDVQQIAAKLTGRTRAIMVVHIFGLPVDIDPILQLADRHGLRIIEDAAELIGQDYKGKPCGSFGDISTFSFYSNKHVTTGEGGMITTDNEELANRCRSLRNLCFDENNRFIHRELGWNYRMTNFQAAVGVAQLERLDNHIERKRQIGEFYTSQLRDIRAIELPVSECSYARNIYWVYGVVLKDDIRFDAKGAMRQLGERGIGTRPFFWPMHEQPVFKKQKLFDGVECPVAERIARRGFYIPSGLAITKSQQEKVVKAMREVFAD